jgi:hypothetical protein
MYIYVRNYLVHDCRTVRLEVEPTDTVVMAQLQLRLGCSPDLLELVEEHERKRMYHDSGGTLAEYNLKDGSTLVLDLNHRAAIAADVEDRRLKMAKQEIAAAIEEQKLKKANKDVAAGIEDQKLIPKAKATESDRKLKKAKVNRVEGTTGVPARCRQVSSSSLLIAGTVVTCYYFPPFQNFTLIE